jgi:hypothetical protein
LNNNKRRIPILWVECSLRKLLRERERERERLMGGGEKKCHEIVPQLKQNILDLIQYSFLPLELSDYVTCKCWTSHY